MPGTGGTPSGTPDGSAFSQRTTGNLMCSSYIDEWRRMEVGGVSFLHSLEDFFWRGGNGCTVEHGMPKRAQREAIESSPL